MKPYYLVFVAAALVALGGAPSPKLLDKFDVLGLGASLPQTGDKPDTGARYGNWFRYRNQAGVWVQDSSTGGEGYDESIKAACYDYLKRTGRGEYAFCDGRHHARLWVLDFRIVPPKGEVIIGGYVTLWYDVQEKRVVAETKVQ